MKKVAYILGVTVQAMTLGGLTFLAVFKIAGMATGAQVFQYQGF